jgi:HEAT repeat protein
MPLFKPNISALKQKRDIHALLETMRTQDPHLRREAMRAIIDIGKPALAALDGVLINEHIAAAIQTDVVEILVAIRDASSIEALLRAVDMSRKREVTAIEQTTSASDRVYRPGFYVNQIAASEGLFRNTIATAIGKLGGSDAVRALFKMMTEEKGAMATNIQAAIKSAMREALQSADSAVIRHLSELMPSGSIDVGGDQAVAELMEIAADGKEEFSVRATAVSSIGKIADRRIIPALEEMQYSGNRTFVREVQGALEAIRMRFPPLPIE